MRFKTHASKDYAQWREKEILRLAKSNPEYAYIRDKKNPDPALSHEIWIKMLAKSNGI